MSFKKSIYHIQIADMLRDMIATGNLKEGDKINENEICADLGVSKTPLREALRVLSVEGLVDLIPNRGAFVTQPEFTEIREMFDVMILLEGYCARTACGTMNSKDFEHLEKLHSQLEQKVKNCDHEGYIRINNKYHSFIQRLAGNSSLNQIIDGLRKRILLYRFKSLNAQGRMAESIQEHRELMEVFRKRDYQKAEILMQHHLKKQLAALENMVQQLESGQ